MSVESGMSSLNLFSEKAARTICGGAGDVYLEFVCVKSGRLIADNSISRIVWVASHIRATRRTKSFGTAKPNLDPAQRFAKFQNAVRSAGRLSMRVRRWELRPSEAALTGCLAYRESGYVAYRRAPTRELYVAHMYPTGIHAPSISCGTRCPAVRHSMGNGLCRFLCGGC
jgi:hypothetical protein